MKKMVGTILAAVTLVALVPNSAFASSRPMPPTVNAGANGASTGTGSKNGAASGHVILPSKRALPPVGFGFRVR